MPRDYMRMRKAFEKSKTICELEFCDEKLEVYNLYMSESHKLMQKFVSYIASSFWKVYYKNIILRDVKKKISDKLGSSLVGSESLTPTHCTR